MKLAVRSTHVVILLWILLLSSLIWHKATMSDQLPITDAFEYYAKAKHFWDAIGSNKAALAPDAEPVFRPFGTVLMSYPFGFSEDPRPFYFRSVIYGIVALMLAVLIAATRPANDERSGGWIVFVALSATVLPMFYHFEASEQVPSAPVFWGLVDGFFAGLTALAAGAVVRAVARRSMAWTFVAILLAAYSLLVKPTGSLIMIIIATTWFTGVLLMVYRERETHARRKALILLGGGSISFVLVFGGVLWWCTQSPYLSGASMAYGSNAMSTLQADWNNTRTWQAIRGSLYPSFGIFFPLAMIVPPVFLICTNRLRASFWRTYGWHVAAATVTLCAGLWLWLVTSNATQVRYLFPFALAALIFALPPLEFAFATVGPAIKWGALALLVSPLATTVVILFLPDVPRVWQDRLGVNLDAGPAPAEGKAAETLLRDIRSDGKSGVTVYDLTMGSIASRVLESRAQYERLVHADKQSYDIVSATDWVPPSVVKTREIIDSDYILAAPPSESGRAALPVVEDSDFQNEAIIFKRWGEELGAKNGTVVLATGPSFTLYKILDRDKLENSLAEFRGGRAWRAAFVEQNPAYWWSKEQLNALLRDEPVALKNVKFDSIYEIQAVRIRNTGGIITVDLWWSGPEKGGATGPDRMFLHLQDRQNAIVRITASWLHPRSPLDASTPLRLTSFRMPATPGETMSVAFGIYDGAAKFLLADGGPRDWANRRVVLPVPP